ncbi:MAG: BTAD domain-containing putative transcriptional regulator [Caldilineaceae bacterium]
MRLASLLWPDVAAATARAYLRHALLNLRQVLQQSDDMTTPPLLVTRTALQFNSHCAYVCDVHELERVVQQARGHDLDVADTTRETLKCALQGYKGVFLDGLELHDCADFEEWVGLTRAKIEQFALEGFTLLTAYYEQIGQYEKALQSVQQQLDIAPWLEEAHYKAMYYLACTGQRSAALQQYQRCQQLLAEMLDVAPNAEITALYEQIKQGVGQPLAYERLLNHIDASTREGEENTNGDGTFRSPDRASGPQSSLPTHMTALLGRQEDIGAIGQLLRSEKVRLLTLVGVGGVGKTRLAIEAMRQLQTEADIQVVYVALEPIQDAVYVLKELATALGIDISGEQTPITRLVSYLRHMQIVLLLDNFEHLLPAAEQVSTLLQECPRLKIVATSRERLHLYGEFEYSVSPLPTPSLEDHSTIDSLSQIASIQLFVDRMRFVDATFAISFENMRVVSQICAALDGIPLAIELVIGQSRFFAPHELLAQLQQSIAIISQGPTDAPARHQTLEDTIGWSYALLKPIEQAIFRRLAIFADGFTLEAAQAMCNLPLQDADIILPSKAIRYLTTLLDKNLLYRAKGDGREARYAMLQTIRHFGLDLLTQRGELDVVAQVHLQYFATMADEAERIIRYPGDHDWLHRLDTEYANMRAALQYGRGSTHQHLYWQLAGSLGAYWLARRYYQEGYRVLNSLMSSAETIDDSQLSARILFYCGCLTEKQANASKSLSLIEESLALYRALACPSEAALCLNALGIGLRSIGLSAKSEKLHRESLSIYRQLQDAHGLALGHERTGGRIAAKWKVYRGYRGSFRSEEMGVQFGDRLIMATADGKLGYVYRLLGEYNSAKYFCRGVLNP